jgi:ubiquinone/menaquinone biosynthesis C-methylase UbiE
MEKEIQEKILKETEAGYDMISHKFSQTRNRFWRGLEFIEKYAKRDDNILDFGCGNGRLAELFKGKNVNYFGVDTSGKLIEYARENENIRNELSSIEFVKLDYNFEKIPFRDNFFGNAYAIAVFHHVPSDELREKYAKELFRTISEGVYVIITVWDLWQPKYRKKVWRKNLDKLLGRSFLDWNDVYITFTDNEGKVFNRYHHAFTKRYLKKLFKKAGFEIELIKRIDGNIVLVGRK